MHSARWALGLPCKLPTLHLSLTRFKGLPASFELLHILCVR